MEIADIRTRVQKNCCRNYPDFNNMIDSWVNNCVKEKLLLLNNLWFMEYYGTIPTVSGTRNYALPGLYKDDMDDGVVYRNSENGTIPLDLLNEPEVLKQWTEDDPGEPVAVVLKGDTYDVWPLPDAAYNIDWKAYLFLADLSDANPSNYLSINYPDVYINAGTYEGFLFIEEYESAALWLGKLEASIDKITTYNVMRKLGKVTIGASPDAKSTYKNARRY